MCWIMGRESREPRDHLQHLHLWRKSALKQRVKELSDRWITLYSGKELKLLVLWSMACS